MVIKDIWEEGRGVTSSLHLALSPPEDQSRCVIDSPTFRIGYFFFSTSARSRGKSLGEEPPATAACVVGAPA